VRRLPKPDTLFHKYKSDGTGGEEVRFKGMLDDSEKKHHLFISYKWKTSYDKVISLEPDSTISTLFLSPMRSACPSEQLRCRCSTRS